jgi:hypothetical protein
MAMGQSRQPRQRSITATLHVQYRVCRDRQALFDNAENHDHLVSLRVWSRLTFRYSIKSDVYKLQKDSTITDLG